MLISYTVIILIYVGAWPVVQILQDSQLLIGCMDAKDLQWLQVPDLRNKAVDSFPYAFVRGIKKGKPFWILEFMSGGSPKLGGSGRKQTYPGALKQAAAK